MIGNPVEKRCPIPGCGKLIRGFTAEHVDKLIDQHRMFKHPG